MTERKLRSWDEAAAWRRSIPGLFVFTNGVFDFIHPGHVALLERARGLGDALCVGINTDRSARTLQKGRGRPITTAAARARVVAALEAVDGVVLFDQPTPDDLIAHLEPDLLIKGADYRAPELPGAEFVVGRGGRVVCLPTIPEFSTTAIVERIRDTH